MHQAGQAPRSEAPRHMHSTCDYLHVHDVGGLGDGVQLHLEFEQVSFRAAAAAAGMLPAGNGLAAGEPAPWAPCRSQKSK